tara:strand:+ start:164 stop:526 length:363 start_codon:yes stop_codon:yes gene_type:complete
METQLPARERSEQPIYTIRLKVTGKLGMHARPAMSVRDTLSTYDGKVEITSNKHPNNCANGSSIHDLMMLAASKGEILNFEFYGSAMEREQTRELKSRLQANLLDEESKTPNFPEEKVYI